MAFPQNNIYVIFIDYPLNSIQSSRRLYLPIQQRKIYFDELQNGLNCNLYVRVSDFPLYLKNVLNNIFKNVLKTNFLFLEDSLIDSWILDETNFLERIKTKKRKIQKWMKLIQKNENWDVRGKKLFVCAVFLSYAISETNFKKQFHL